MEEIARALRRHSCYDVLPVSSKLVTLDAGLLAKKAFLVLLQNGVRWAPVYDRVAARFVGLLSATDFIHLACFFYRRALSEKLPIDQTLADIEQFRVAHFRTRASEIAQSPLMRFVHASPDHTLQQVLEIFVREACQAVALTDGREARVASATHAANATRADTEDAAGSDSAPALIGMLSQQLLLRFIAANVRACGQRCAAFNMSDAIPHYTIDVERMQYRNCLPTDVLLRDVTARMGTYGAALITVRPTTPLVDVLDLVLKHDLTAVPIVDEEGYLMDVCEKYNIMDLIPDGHYIHLDMPVYAALEKRRSANTDMHTCTLDTSIRAIIEAVGLTDREVLRLLVVEEEESAVGGGGCDGGDRGVAQRKKLAGIVTGYDILSFLLSESRSVDSEGKSEFAAATPSIVSFAEPAA